MYKKDAVLDVGSYQDFYLLEDYYLWLRMLIAGYKGYNIKYLTVHASKGLEADCVILINLQDSTLGFPNKLNDNDILKYVSKKKELYPYDEERRLFYVALTRTKNEIFLLVDKNNQSIFIKEIVKDSKKYIEYI